MKEKPHRVAINVAISHRWLLFVATILAVGFILLTTDETSAQQKLDRTVLPIQPPKRKPVTEMDARKATKPDPFVVEARALKVELCRARAGEVKPYVSKALFESAARRYEKGQVLLSDLDEAGSDE